MVKPKKGGYMLVASFSTRKRFQNKPLTLFITRKDNPFGKNTVNSKGEEPLDKEGEIRFRSARLDYGFKYNSQAIKELEGLNNLGSKDKRRKRKWEIKRLEIGQSPIPTKVGRTEKPRMGKCKVKIAWLQKKQSSNVLSQVSWSNIQNNLKGRRI